MPAWTVFFADAGVRPLLPSFPVALLTQTALRAANGTHDDVPVFPAASVCVSWIDCVRFSVGDGV